MAGLDQGEGAEGIELKRHRVEEHDLDVEQDEEHRDQVEADPEAERALDVGRQPALVGLTLDPARALRPEQVVRHRERRADAEAEQQKDEGGQVALQHCTRRYNATLCGKAT